MSGGPVTASPGEAPGWGAPGGEAGGWRTGLALIVAVVGACAVGAWRGGREEVPLVVGILVGWGFLVLFLRPAGTVGPRLLLAALLVRLPLVIAPPLLSDDIYRYLWEGHVWASGMNPFTWAPGAPELEGIRAGPWASVNAHVNHREVSSVYPPLAQLAFLLLHGAGVSGWKAVMALCDVGTAMLLGRRDPGAGWRWALLPLPVVEAAGSGHLEAAGVLALVLALGGRPVGAWAGAMIKLLPGVLLIPLLRGRPRSWLGYGAATLVAMAPLLAAGPALWRGFERYRQVWAYNGSFYWLFLSLGEGLWEEATARRALQVVGVGIVAGILWRSRDPGRIALWTTGAFVALSPTVHPWYVLWPLAAALWTRVRAWEVLAALMPLSYVVLATYDPATSSWTEPGWVRPVVYIPFYLLLLLEGVRRWTRPGPAPAW